MFLREERELFDSYIRPLINPPLRVLARQMIRHNITANQITFGGFLIGCLAFGALALQFYSLALFFLALNRLADGLDGPVARAWAEENPDYGPSDFGGYLDIVLDMIFYAGFVFFFCVGAAGSFPYGAFLIFSFTGTAASFLTYAIIAAKRGEETEQNGKKSFYHARGLMEGSETILFLVLFCLFPDYFGVLSLLCAGLCWMTIFGRIMSAREQFAQRATTMMR